MVTRRTRAFLAVPLAFALFPLFALWASGVAAARPEATMAWTTVQAKTSTAAQSVRTSTLEAVVHHFAPTPYAPARPFALSASTYRVDTASVTEPTPHSASVTRLHPARAPPAVS